MTGPVPVPATDRLGVVRDVTAWRTGVPGLVVAAIPPESDRCVGSWSVIHARSGSRLPYCFPDPEAALGLALAVGDVTDWQQPGQDVRAAMRTLRYTRAVTRYQSQKCRHGHQPRVITQDNGVIA